MDIGMWAIWIGIIVAGYNLFLALRKNKKQKDQEKNYMLKTLGKSLLLGLLAYIVVVNIDFETEESVTTAYETEESEPVEYGTQENIPATYEIVSQEETETESDQKQEEQKSDYKYTFRSEQLLNEHYEKHGIYMKYKSPEKYLKGANRVIADKDTLHAIEAEDGDDVYYLERTNEFVVVSTDGYIRTYFCPEDGIEYFHRQFE